MYKSRRFWTSGLALLLALSSGGLVAQENQEAKEEWVPPTLPETFSAWAVAVGPLVGGGRIS